MALVVITGGSRSGKSRAAQSLAEELAERGADVVVAVFGRASSDDEMQRRVDAHRRSRPDTLRTLEVTASEAWMDTVTESALVVDCLGTALGLAAHARTDGTRSHGTRSDGSRSLGRRGPADVRRMAPPGA